jgi:1-acyl-sn-glycerol-3-phosphate acyltransferase
MIKAVLRGTAVITVMVSYIPICSIVRLIGRRKGKLKDFVLKTTSLYCQLGMKIMGVSVKYNLSEGIDPSKSYLIVCNHMSYVDILAVFAKFPSVFVTSVEVKKMPLLGKMCELGECHFVERRDRSNIDNEIAKIADVLRGGSSVVIFPEGTTSNGEAVLPFKRSLLKAAIDANVNLQPLCLKYRTINDQEIGGHNRDLVYWYGDMSFFPHLMKLFTLSKIELELTSLPEIKVRPDQTRQELAELSHEMISRHFSQHP